ncbi:MAG: ribonuclease III [Actinomycetota bacterium]|nr:ribonuclease III [Actinomycetota bacterium]
MSRPSRPPGLAALGVPDDPGPLYELALTHRSFAFELPEPGGHNERLEFLGDAILGAVVTALIYERYPQLSEGEMARLRASVVNTEALADEARTLGLGEQMRLGKGEESTGGRAKASLLANIFEALVGAVYVDRGIAEVERALRPLFEAKLVASIESGRYDAKTTLQELVVRDTGELPIYRLASTGPDHDKRFEAHVFIDGDLSGSGRGKSKKEAEQRAARAALDRLEDQTGARSVADDIEPDPRSQSEEPSDARAS